MLKQGQVERSERARDNSPHTGEKQSCCSMKNTRRDPLTHEQAPARRESRYFPGLPVCSEEPVHSFCLLAWEIWLMTWQRSSMQIANICHSAGSSPYIYLLILLNISAYYWLFVGGGQWCMFLHDALQKKAISCNPLHPLLLLLLNAYFVLALQPCWRSGEVRPPLLWK